MGSKVPADCIGNAGECYVLAELFRRGWKAGLMPRGMSDFDILASKGRHQIKLRVKTKSSQSDDWQWSKTKSPRGDVYARLTDEDYAVFVALSYYS